MIIIAIVLSLVGFVCLCWLPFVLAVHALPFFALCGWPHKTNYVASHHMWRTPKQAFLWNAEEGFLRHIF